MAFLKHGKNALFSHMFFMVVFMLCFADLLENGWEIAPKIDVFLGNFRHVSIAGYKAVVEWKGDDESLFAVVKKGLLY